MRRGQHRRGTSRSLSRHSRVRRTRGYGADRLTVEQRITLLEHQIQEKIATVQRDVDRYLLLRQTALAQGQLRAAWWSVAIAVVVLGLGALGGPAILDRLRLFH